MIASEPVASALAKLMIFNHAAFVPAENVYSVGKIGKDAVLERILNRFHRKRVIIVSSNAPETGQLAYRVRRILLVDVDISYNVSILKEGRIPFWHIRSLYDIDKFWLALEYVLLVNVNDEEGRQHEHQQNSQQSQINLYAENSIIEPKPASGISKMI